MQSHFFVLCQIYGVACCLCLTDVTKRKSWEEVLDFRIVCLHWIRLIVEEINRNVYDSQKEKQHRHCFGRHQEHCWTNTDFFSERWDTSAVSAAKEASTTSFFVQYFEFLSSLSRMNIIYMHYQVVITYFFSIFLPLGFLLVTFNFVHFFMNIFNVFSPFSLRSLRLALVQSFFFFL